MTSESCQHRLWRDDRRDRESARRATGARLSAMSLHYGAGIKSMLDRIGKRTYGTVNASDRGTMTGLEFVRGLADGSLPLNTIAQTLGYDVTEAGEGRVVISANPNDTLLNPAGTVHGGFSATLLDSCMGLAIQSTLDKGLAQTTLEFRISLVRPITTQTGPITAEGAVLSRGRRIGTAEGRIVDRNGRLLAHGTTTCLIFEVRHPAGHEQVN